MISDAGAPLLPTKCVAEKRTDKEASISGAVFNVSTSIIGAGIMSIPATLKVLGVIPAFFLIVTVALLSDLSVNFLLRFTNSGGSANFSGEPATYGGVMRESFGWIGSLLVKLCVIISNWGCLIVYLIILGDVFSGSENGESIHLGVLQEWFGSHWWNARPYALFFIVVFILLPLALFRRVESLRFSSAVAVLLAVVFVCISFVMAISALFEGNVQKPRLFPELDGHSSFFNLFTAVPVIVTAFTFHFNVHPISSELGKPSKMTTATRISLILCVVIYFSVGFFGYLLFGESIASDILVNFDRSSASPFLNDVVRLSYAFHLVLVYPLLNFSLRGNIDELLFPKKLVLANDKFRFISLTLVLLGLSYLAAIAIPDIWIFFQYVGSTTIISIAFIFPAAITLRDVRGISSTRDKVVALIMLTLAVVTSTISIATNIFNESKS
ncbi:amino acid transporter AVT6C-like [Chenopodium quinoa]|uniref:Amino acid transporter transmembrane domain-containing protein n=1 Tax=Chenopodium quinoa TaxID=63459 RepID=A0A803M425_CHEQI|nr:amino acid transporter AVT6C-like [Chenopodium quinoa]